MSGLSVYSEKNALNAITGQNAMPFPTAVWMGLFTTQPTTGDGSGTEVTGGSYARVQVAGQVTVNGATLTSSPTLHFASLPAFLTTLNNGVASGVGMNVYDITTGAVVGQASAIGTTTITLVANAASAVGSTDVLSFSAFPQTTTGGGTAPSTCANTSIITMPTPTASWGTIVGFGLFDASTSGNLLNDDYLGNFAWIPVSVSSASPGVITAKANGYTVGDTVVFTNEYGGTAPSFSASNFTGLLAVAHQATDTIDVTNAATAVNTSSTGSGMVRKVASQSIPSSVVASFAASSLTLSMA